MLVLIDCVNQDMSAQDVSVNRLFVNQDMSAQDVSVNRLYVNMDMSAQMLIKQIICKSGHVYKDVSVNRLYVNADMSAQDVSVIICMLTKICLLMMFQ